MPIQRPFRIIGHRGARALAPENTLAGLKAAIALGVHGIEIDVAMTRDQICVLHHDACLNPSMTRAPDGAWLETTGPAIVSLSLDELRNFDVGRPRPGSAEAERWPRLVPSDREPIPTLADACRLVAAALGVELTVEIKTFPDQPELTHPFERILDEVVSTLDSHGLARQAMIESFDWRVPVRLAAIAPRIRRGFLTSRAYNLNSRRVGTWTAGFDPDRFDGRVDRAIAAAGGQVWAIHHVDLAEGEIREAQEAGLDLLPWTVNEAAEIERLVALGVGAAISDVPDDVARVVAGRLGASAPSS